MPSSRDAGAIREAIEEYRRLLDRLASEGHLLRAIAVCHMILQLDPDDPTVPSTLASLSVQRDARTRDAGPDLDRLATIPLFSDLARDELVSIVKDLRRRVAPRGETIVTEGEDGTSMYVIVEGAVRVTRTPPGVEPRVLGDMRDGEFFGEIALLARTTRLASVVALGPTELLELGREQLDAIVERHPRVGEVVARFCKERLLGNMLRAAPLFKLLPSERLDAVVDLFRVQTCDAGTVLLEKGAPGKGLFVLLRGECEVFHPRDDGTAVPYPAMHEGDVFGELSLLQGGPVTATVRAKSTCVLLLLQREWFDELLLQTPAVRERIYAVAGERAQRTREVYAREQIERCLV
jgi:cAMP-dependent protein kinase regulator